MLDFVVVRCDNDCRIAIVTFRNSMISLQRSASLLVPLLAMFCLITAASAGDAQLAALHSTLVSLRTHTDATLETAGASPELTVAKHQLRDWIETQLRTWNDVAELEAFSNQINEKLKKVDAPGSGDDENLLGSVGEVRVSSEAGILIITTGVGIVCQNDESAYAYKRVDNRWKRIWESEQNDYSPKKYAPQLITAVHVLQSYKDGHEDGPAYVMMLGHGWGCASWWHPVYYRLWRVDPSGAKLLIDGFEGAYLRADSFAIGSIVRNRFNENSPVDALIEFTERSVDSDILIREAIRHYLIYGDRVQRVDPVALSPRDFVDEWLTRSWDESAGWSAAPALKSWHLKLHADWVGGEFTDVTKHCETPDLWQVTFAPSNAQKNFEAEPAVYFLVRWRPPYHFTMVNISDKHWPLCIQEDPEADEWRTLFSTQEWRQ